ncbi:Nesprin-2 [Nibea albiflora]|uniref:Nesprin-2 n=1 Tax=Nibea albiflora TaxID=240163 RepID=A0ACB7FA84_NIBAL|nr:Nesprin-2 [Nibea albiflora]
MQFAHCQFNFLSVSSTVEHEQIQKRTFTNWINAQLSKRCPPSFVSDLFSELRDGSQLLDLLEVMSGQPMIKLVNINISDIIDGRPSIILGLIWTIILHCHIEELANTLSYSSCHSSLDSLSSLDSWSGSPVPASPVPAGRASPLHRRFRVSAKKALLMWVRDQCKRVGCSVSMRDFRSSWRSGEAFLAILCSLRPQLVDLSLVQSRSNQENLEEAFQLAERELHIPRLLEPQDVDVKDPDEKSIMTYVAQFLQYSNDMPAPDDHLEVFQNLAGSFSEQRKPVLTLLAAIRRRPELSQEQRALRTAWDRLEEELQRCKADLDSSLPPPLDSVVVWLQRAEAALTEEGGKEKDHADAAKKARGQQDTLKTLIEQTSHYVNILDAYHNTDDSGNVIVPLEKFDEIQRRLTDIRVTVQVSRDQAGIPGMPSHCTGSPGPRRCEGSDLEGSLQLSGDSACASAGLAFADSQRAARQVKEAESEAESVTQAATAVRVTMERVVSAWETYNSCIASLQTVASTEDTFTRPVSCCRDAVSSEPSVGPQCLQLVHSLTQEATRLLRQPLEVASVPLKANRQKLQLLSKKMADMDFSSLTSSQTSHTEKLQETLPQTLADAERSCAELQRAASRLEGRLAELDRWSTEALDCHQHLKEKKHRGRSALETTAKVLISRGLQLESQMVSEGQDLQDLVARVQKTSPLQHLSTSGMQDRISEAHSLCQEILGMFSLLGFLQHVEIVHPTQRQPEAGLLVVARTKHVDPIGNVKLQDPTQVSPENPSQTVQQTTTGLQDWRVNTQDGPTVVISHVQIQMLPQPLKEPESHIHTPLSQTVKEDESLSKLHAQASSPVLTPVGPKSPKSPVLSKQITSPVPDQEKESSSPSQISRTRGQPNTAQSNKISPQPPVIVHRELRSKAQSMARSRLEKARFRLQGRIQQAIKLFSGKEISEPQAKRKQRALKILQPAVLDEFLGAVEGLGAFCTEPQLQDLMLLSESVRKQWEDVRREIAAFVPVLWSKIREGKQSLSVVQCEAQTNAPHEATDRCDRDPLLRQKAAMDEAASVEERVESLQEVCETLTPRKSPSLATEQLKESDEAQETPSDTELPSDCRGQQLGGSTPLRATGMSADTQQCNDLPQKQSGDSPKRDLSPLGRAASVRSSGDFLQLRARDIPAQSEGDLTQRKKDLKPSHWAKEQPLKARLLDITESRQQTQTQIQAVVTGTTVESKHEAEWTVIAEAAARPQEEQSLEQEVLERYRNSCLAFQSQLQKNKQHLEASIPHRVTIASLQNQEKQLQAITTLHSYSTIIQAVCHTLKQETEALWFEFELQYAQLSQRSHLKSTEGEVGRDWTQLSQQWRSQQMCLKSRMTSVENTANLMESADDQMTLIREKLDQILRESVDISSFTLTDPRLLSDLKEMDNRLQSEMRKLSEEEERQGLDATSHSPLFLALHNSVHHLEQLRQRLEKVQSAVRDLDRFLAAVREAEAEIPTLLANRDPSRQQNEADLEQQRHSWQAAMQQKLQTAAEQSDSVDSTLKAVGMTLAIDGATATCQDVLTSLSQKAVDVEKELMGVRKRERKVELLPMGKEQIQELNLSEIRQTETEDDSPQEQEYPTACRMEEESGTEAKMSWLNGNNATKTHREKEVQRCKPEEDVLKARDERRRRISQVKKEGEEKESLVQRRFALLVALREIMGAAEQLGLQEPSLPALQQRTRALTELESRLVGHLAELQHIQDASLPDVSHTREVEEVLDEATKAVAERLERCNVLTELLKRFQSLRGELNGTLQSAESTISEQASYMGRDNLQRLHTKVRDTKAELSGLGDGIEEVRSVCRHLHTHLRHIPECTVIPFEDEADALMDRWLDISERTDSHSENLHLSLTLWDGVLQLGAEVESWTANKLAAFAQSPSFQSEEDVGALQNEIRAQEESMERLHRRATEIQVLLQSSEPPLELQVVETQMRKKIEQLKEVVSEAEDVYRQTVAAKEHITTRMVECFDSLQKIQDSLVTLGGSDVATVLAKLKVGKQVGNVREGINGNLFLLQDLLFELQTQDEQAESVLEDLRVLASIASSSSLQSLSEDGMQLQDKVRDTHQLLSAVGEDTERNIQALDR